MTTKDKFRLMKLQERYNMPHATEHEIGNHVYKLTEDKVKQHICK